MIRSASSKGWPASNQVELQIDTMPLADAIDFVNNDAFRANPIGIKFDPQEINRRRKTGAPTVSLTAYAS